MLAGREKVGWSEASGYSVVEEFAGFGEVGEGKKGQVSTVAENQKAHAAHGEVGGWLGRRKRARRPRGQWLGVWTGGER